MRSERAKALDARALAPSGAAQNRSDGAQRKRAHHIAGRRGRDTTVSISHVHRPVRAGVAPFMQANKDYKRANIAKDGGAMPQ